VCVCMCVRVCVRACVCVSFIFLITPALQYYYPVIKLHEGVLCVCVCLQLSNVDRLSQKLRAMSYIANFNDAFHNIHPVTLALTVSTLLRVAR